MGAQDGKAGLEAAKSEKPDIILLDVIMPIRDWYEVCEHLKEDDSTKEIPIIMVTSKAEAADKVKGLELGALDYVTKPFHVEEVLVRVNTHTSIQQMQKQLELAYSEVESKVKERTKELNLEIKKHQQTEEELQNALKELKT